MRFGIPISRHESSHQTRTRGHKDNLMNAKADNDVLGTINSFDTEDSRSAGVLFGADCVLHLPSIS